MNEVEFSEKLLKYYDRHRRVLPFREDPTPYKVWVSEIMCQQTRIDTVLPYFDRFITKNPSVQALASCPEEELLKLWEGLGYYSRVRNMQKAAIQIVEEYDGQIPGDVQELIKLPGIGSYTAAAISSIAFGQKEPAMDGNLYRVMSRYLAYEKDLKHIGHRRELEKQVKKRMPSDRPGDFNQALMDIGATICIPNGYPDCDRCPLQTNCQAYRKNRVLDFPQWTKKKERRREEYTVLIVCCNGQIAMQQRPKKGLLGGLWQFPMLEGHLGEKEIQSHLTAWGFDVLSVRPSVSAKHIFSHIEWQMTSYHIDVLPMRVKEKSDLLWFDDKSFEALTVPTAFQSFRNEWRKESKNEGS